jgi:hypothetical protein
MDGILSRGSVSCSGRDEYVITDPQWLENAMESRCWSA